MSRWVGFSPLRHATLGANTFTGAQTIPAGLSLIFGAATSSNPALKSSSTTLQVRLADDSDFANLSANAISASSSGGMNIGGDVVLNRDGANILALRSGTSAQQLRVYKTTTSTQYIGFDATGTGLVKTTYALGNGAAAQTGTLTNAPAAGNPTKWIPLDDNGTTRYVPAW